MGVLSAARRRRRCPSPISTPALSASSMSGVGHLAESSATVAVVVETAIGIAEVLASIEVLLVACPPPGARARLLG